MCAGKKIWVFPDGDLPDAGDGHQGAPHALPVRWWRVAVDGRRLGLAGAVLAVTAVVLFAFRGSLTMDVQDLLLLVAGVAGISFAVGWTQRAAKKLERMGCRAIAAECGYFAYF